MCQVYFCPMAAGLVICIILDCLPCDPRVSPVNQLCCYEGSASVHPLYVCVFVSDFVCVFVSM